MYSFYGKMHERIYCWEKRPLVLSFGLSQTKLFLKVEGLCSLVLKRRVSLTGEKVLSATSVTTSEKLRTSCLVIHITYFKVFLKPSCNILKAGCLQFRFQETNLYLIQMKLFPSVRQAGGPLTSVIVHLSASII